MDNSYNLIIKYLIDNDIEYIVTDSIINCPKSNISIQYGDLNMECSICDNLVKISNGDDVITILDHIFLYLNY